MAFSANAQKNTTPEYDEIIEAYRSLSHEHSSYSRLIEVGSTDAGLPLHLFIIDPSGKFDPEHSHSNDALVCLIMNGIHPGEPCGIDAALAFAEAKAAAPSEGIVYCIIPVYNVGGAMNRNSTSRANQNGPEAYGFRGNAKNLDLNRDFIKSDALNTFAFAEIFHNWQPHVFVDTHTSNGADYQPNITLISTIPERLHPLQGRILTADLLPKLYRAMEEADEPMLPYVNTVNGLPESGLKAFTDLPRYSTGYASLWGTIGFTTEAHMLKPYAQRVEATRTFIEVLDTLLQGNKQNIISIKKAADAQVKTSKAFSTRWKLSDEADSVSFAGYRVDSITSAVTGMGRVKYNRQRPFTEKVAYYNTHEPDRTFDLPAAFVIPQAWSEVIERLEANGIKMRILPQDSTLEVTAHYVEHYNTVTAPYEGRYLHFDTEVSSRTVPLTFRKGDVIINCNQAGNRYLAHVFDPISDDSFFNWGFFDAVLMQKEYFSTYLFEETAAEILKRNTMLSKEFQEKKRSDPEFASDARAQLDFVYRNSKYYEDSHRRIPVFRLERP